jgi:voltage-gated potassium channel
MPGTSELDRVTSIVLRYMRAPIIVLVSVSAIALIGMVLMPGQDADGNPVRMSFFHALYFLTYTATTTGFGEIPHPFTDAQRLWAMVCLVTSVIAWLYAIGSIISLVQNPHFLSAIARRRFRKSVARIGRPFTIIGGFGDTGSLLTRGLDNADATAVILDKDPERIKALSLRDYRRAMPGVQADASAPANLIAAGIKRRNCRAVVALTPSEDVNVKIAVMARLLNPSVRVICLATSSAPGERLEAIGGVETVDPFDAFSSWLSTALFAPSLHTLTHWLIGAPGVTLDKPLSCPAGAWILCGYGRMGRRVRSALHANGVKTVVIDPDMEDADDLPEEEKVTGYANAETLRQAGIDTAVGVVAATDNDSDNLAILLRARSLNPRVSIIVRQNHHENELAFQEARADLIMQPSLVTARNILFQLISPSVQIFLDHLREHHGSLMQDVTQRLQAALGGNPPHLWTVNMTDQGAFALAALHQRRQTVTLGDVMRNHLNRERTVACVPLVLTRYGTPEVLPDASRVLLPGDSVLFCGTRHAERLVDAALNNTYTLHYLVTGVQEPRGYFMKWFARRMPSGPASRAQITGP